MDVKQKIISSVFNKRSPPETYVSHVKIWEDSEEGGRKPRYILLSKGTNGEAFIHKSKMNTNASFSIGKTWRLLELKGLEVVDPNNFIITLSRSYKWNTEDAQEQKGFISATISTYRSIPGARGDLSLVNVSDSPTSRPPPSDRAPTPSRNISSGRDPSNRNARQLAASPARPLSPPRTTNGTMRPDSMYSVASAPSIYPPRNAIPPVPRPSTGTQGSSRPSLDEARSSTASDRQISAQRINRGASPTPSSSIRSARTPSPIPPSRPPPSQVPSSTLSQSSNNQSTSRKASDELRPPRSRPSREPSSSSLASNVKKETNTRNRNARISFFDPANQAVVDRLLANTGALEDESPEAIMVNVEEMLEGYEWAGESSFLSGEKRKRGTGDQIEARLQNELMALEKASIYAFLEDDDRVGLVLKFVDDAIEELDGMETLVSSYRIHLNSVSDDISYIQSQNRGLQVQTQNQKALLEELEKLFETVHVDRETLILLTQESLEKQSGIERLEVAAAELYRALLGGKDTDMAATMERLEEYKTHNYQFGKRLHDYLQIRFSVQSDKTLNTEGRRETKLLRHKEMEEYLARYAGLTLYLKEMNDEWYSKVCATYFSTASALHSQEMKDLFNAFATQVKKATDEEAEMSFSPTQSSAIRGTEGLRRAKSLARSPLDARNKDKDKRSDGDLRGSEALNFVLAQIGPQIFYEEKFVEEFLHVNEISITFADYMGMDSYFRRQASRSLSVSLATQKLIRGAMDLIFGFLAGEIKTWIDIALAKDPLQIVGMLVTLENTIRDSNEKGNVFWSKALQKQEQRAKTLYDQHVAEQIRAIEQTKLSARKRKGVALFIKYFPTYIGRVENQLINMDNLEVRRHVDVAYEKIVQTMFDSLKQMAKVEGEGEDKGQINYHVELLENMRYFISEMTQQQVGNVRVFVQQAQAMYDENLTAYVKLILRRPMSKILDYFDGVERLLKTTAPSEISNNPTYNKTALKRVMKDYNAKDIRRHIDSLFKRVEKHFSDPEDLPSNANASLLKAVWTACEQELVKSVEQFQRIVTQCYKDSGVGLDFTAQDVEAAFRKHRLSGVP